MTTRLVDLPTGPMANTVVKYDNGRPLYACDLRLGNRKMRRRLLAETRRDTREQRAQDADAST